MSNQVAYSGISAKIRAMESRLLSPSQYEELAGNNSVADAIAYLKGLTAYSECLSGYDAVNIHRRQLEKVISNSLYSDFIRLYKFADMNQKQFLNIYFLRFEVAIVKECLCTLFETEAREKSFFQIKDFFKKHTGIDLNQLSTAVSIDDFIEKTRSSELYQTLLNISNLSSPGLAEYEMALDSYYFTQFWKRCKKLLHNEDYTAITDIYGHKIDLLNIQWIYRAKKYHNMSIGQIYSVVIPIHYKLKAAELKAMIEADSVEALYSLVSSSYYGKFTSADSGHSLEDVYYKLQDDSNDKISRQYPFSAAILNNYLHKKETERNRIISIIEGIRYGMDTNSILAEIQYGGHS